MKRKGLLFVALTMLLCVLSLCFVACNEKPHIHDYKMQTSDTMHWLKCDCGDTKENNAHGGGTATCVNKAKCATCNEEYGELGNHSYGGWKTNSNSTHSKTCIYDNTHVITENCSGGTATCEEKAVCTDCLSGYGEELGHNYVDIVTQPTYTERGYTTHICSCGYKYIDTYIEKLKYKIHLETNGGQCDIDCVEYLLGDRVSLPIPSKGELFFEGWFVDPDCKERFTAGYYNNCDTTILYAAYSSYDLSAYEFVEYGNGWDLVAYTGNETKIIAPEIYKNKPIIRIYNTVYAYNTQLIELTIPDSILYLQEGLLSGCTSLKILTISSLPSKLGLLFNKHTFDISVTINDVIESGWDYRSYGSYYYAIPYGPWSLKNKWYTYNGSNYLYQGESVHFIERTQRITYNGSNIDSYSAPCTAIFVAYSIPKTLEKLVVTKQVANDVKDAITNCDWFTVIVDGQTIAKPYIPGGR